MNLNLEMESPMVLSSEDQMLGVTLVTEKVGTGHGQKTITTF